MSFLASVGRADIPQAIQRFQKGESDLAIADTTQKLRGLQVQGAEQNLEIQKRQMANQAQKEQDMKRPIPIEVLGSTFEGGLEGPMGQSVYKLADQYGYVDKSRGGLGTITKENAKEVFKLMHQPEIASGLSRQRVQFHSDRYRQALQAAQEKPGDEKAQANLQQAKTAYMQAVGQDDALMKGMAAMEEKKGADGGGFTLSEGQTRFDETGAKVASVPKPVGGGESDALSRKIAEIQKANPELSYRVASGLATGTISTKTDPVTGQLFIVDETTGTKKQVTPPREVAAPEEPEGPPEPKLFELAELTAGPVSGATAGASKISGMVGGPVAEQTEQARQYVTTAKNDLIRALSINPRFPVGEIKRIEREIDIAPKLLDNPQSLQNRMKAIDQYLRRRVKKEESVASNENMPAQARQDALSAAENIKSFVDLLGVPPTITSELWEKIKDKPGTKFYDEEGTLREVP